MRAVLVANGELTAHARLKEIWLRANLRIAADGGARNARVYLRIAPHAVIGDFDSLDDETRDWLEKSSCEFIRYPPAKDATDLELALQLAQTRGADEITILGAHGGRADHFLANVLLLTQARNVRLVDGLSEMWLVGEEGGEGKEGREGKEGKEGREGREGGEGTEGTEIAGRKGDLVSLIPLDERVDGIVTHGLEYPLRGETLERGSTRGISNVMLDRHATVRATRGALLIVHLFQ
ncbi:MAG: thiamine diphosphokinase [Chloroflexi bacterium]|nr:thiamine diphosphokinase [Chloroflexota bacterium]